MRTRGRAKLPDPVVEVVAEDTKAGDAPVKVRLKTWIANLADRRYRQCPTSPASPCLNSHLLRSVDLILRRELEDRRFTYFLSLSAAENLRSASVPAP